MCLHLHTEPTPPARNPPTANKDAAAHPCVARAGPEPRAGKERGARAHAHPPGAAGRWASPLSAGTPGPPAFVLAGSASRGPELGVPPGFGTHGVQAAGTAGFQGPARLPCAHRHGPAPGPSAASPPAPVPRRPQLRGRRPVPAMAPRPGPSALRPAPPAPPPRAGPKTR